MKDTYLDLVNNSPLKSVAKALGLPQPVELRRYGRGRDLVSAPVLVLGTSDTADAVAETLLGWELEVRRNPVVGERIGAIIAAYDNITDPSRLGSVTLGIGEALRALTPNARVVTVSRARDAQAAPAANAVASGVQGILRSLAKELRRGATANGIILDGVGAEAPSFTGALRFLLSARSAFVDGQFLTVETAGGALPESWDSPLAGRTAVVTGAARGIGEAIAKTLHRDGATIIGVDVPAAGQSLASVMNQVRGTALQLDITAADAGEKIAAAAPGGIDILVHNAGITRDKLLANMDESRWDSVVAVNLASQLAMNEALLEKKAFGAAPRVVSLASTSGIAGNRGQTNYAATKAGVIGMVEAAAGEFAKLGGGINAVAPGFIETEMTAKIPALTRQVARRLNSLQQGGQPIDVAEAIAFLSAPQSGGINGEVLRVCGQNLVGA